MTPVLLIAHLCLISALLIGGNQVFRRRFDSRRGGAWRIAAYIHPLMIFTLCLGTLLVLGNLFSGVTARKTWDLINYTTVILLLMGVLMMIFSRGRCMSSFNPQMVRKQTTQDYTLYVPNPHSAPFTSRLKYVLVYLGTAFNLLNFFM